MNGGKLCFTKDFIMEFLGKVYKELTLSTVMRVVGWNSLAHKSVFLVSNGSVSRV